MAELMDITTAQLLNRSAAEYGQRPAVHYPDRNLQWTYQELREQARHVARGLIGLGVRPGEHVSIWAANRPEWLLTQLGTGVLGAVLVTVNTNHRSAELAQQLEHSQTSTLVLQAQFKDIASLEILDELIPELRSAPAGELHSERFPHLRRVICLDPTDHPGVLGWDALLEAGSAVSETELDEYCAQVSPDDATNMQYTSAADGSPKGVLLTHKNIINNGAQVAERMRLGGDDRLCVPVPFFHCFGCVLGNMGALASGATLVPVESFHPRTVLETVETGRCTALHGVPTMFRAELDDPDFERFDLSTLRTGIMAGAECPRELMEAVMERMGATEMTIAYGLTEASPAITQTAPDDPLDQRVATVGRPLQHVEVKIVDPSGGTAPLPTGEAGELCARGPNIMKGYFNDPEATQRAIDADGWLHTGNLADRDEHGYFRILGVLQEMVIRGGENIYPKEIEAYLQDHPEVAEAAVVGVPDANYGEELSAWVVPAAGANPGAEAIRAYCRSGIARFKVPRYIDMVESLPKEDGGGVDKAALREQAVTHYANPSG